MLFSRRRPPVDHPPFLPLPVRTITVAGPGDHVAVHVSGELTSPVLPLVCVPGYQRNMTDHAALLEHLRKALPAGWPVVLLDLRGRGRSSDRANPAQYVTTEDARDLLAVGDALGLADAVYLGQGYGGQVIMAMAGQRPSAIAGSILIDAGPVSNPRGLVRLRNNLQVMEGLTNQAAAHGVMSQVLNTDYPGISTAMVETITARTHRFDKRGRARPLFDRALIKLLDRFAPDDVLVAQWPLFAALSHAPMLIMRTQLTDLLRRDTFEDMARRRRDATALVVAGQGSPALLDGGDEVAAIARFLAFATERADKRRGPRRAFAAAMAAG